LGLIRSFILAIPQKSIHENQMAAASRLTEKKFSRPIGLRLDTSLVGENSDFSIALDSILSDLSVTVGVVYRFDRSAREFYAVAWHSRISPPIQPVTARLDALSARSLCRLEAPVQYEQGQPFFDRLPEAIHCGLKIVLVVPMLVRHNLLGIFTLGRTESRQFDKHQTDLALLRARLVRVIFHRDDLERSLEARKLVERAKGILRRTQLLDEEQAYLELRNMSRSRQRAMADVARSIIEADAENKLGHLRSADRQRMAK
jgi:signal transduction protein with GAF and PtsI domain